MSAPLAVHINGTDGREDVRVCAAVHGMIMEVEAQKGLTAAQVLPRHEVRRRAERNLEAHGDAAQEARVWVLR